MDNSTIIRDEIIDADPKPKLNDEETKTFPKNFNEKKETCKRENFYILLAFLLNVIALWKTVIFYCCMIK